MLASLSPPQSSPQSSPQSPPQSPPGSLPTVVSRRPDPAPDGLAGLRARVRAIERGAAYGGLRRRVAPLGAAGLDAHLPGGGLPLGGLHEIEGSRAEWDDGAATGFCVGLLARLLDAGSARRSDNKPVLWVSPWRDLYAPGLRAFGLDPGRLIQVRAGAAGGAGAEVLWAMEEGLRCSRLAAVVGEVETLERGPGRRLQLAAEASGVTAFALRRGLRPARRAAGASAAVTRWRVEAEANAEGPGAREWDRFPERPSWRVELLRCRGAAPGQWCLEWDDAAGGFTMAAALRDRPPALDAGRPGGERVGGGADRPCLAV
jgi:protein ImuA